MGRSRAHDAILVSGADGVCECVAVLAHSYVVDVRGAFGGALSGKRFVGHLNCQRHRLHVSGKFILSSNPFLLVRFGFSASYEVL